MDVLTCDLFTKTHMDNNAIVKRVFQYYLHFHMNVNGKYDN